MKILMVNKFYYNRGGSEANAFGLTRLLESENHEVIPFSMKDKKNFDSKYSKYFVENIDYEQSLKNFGLITGLKVAYRSVYSSDAKTKIIKLIDKVKPDIAHLHNIHYQITPSIIYALKKHSIPIVWTLHDYTLICPNSTFYNNEVCEKCKKRKYYNAFLNRCKKGSLSASFLASVDSYLNLALRTYRLIDAFITPSSFLKNKMIEYGYDSKKIFHIPNFVEKAIIQKETDTNKKNNRIIFTGRLSPEKGVETLIEAVKELDSIELIVAGDGPIYSSLEKKVKKNKLSNIKLVGHLSKEQVFKYISSSRFVIVPSQCYENFPYSVLEAFAAEKTVIGSKIGGIPELIEDGVTGLLFEPGNIGSLKEKIAYLINNPKKAEEMGNNAGKIIENNYATKKHYEKIIDLYYRLVKR